MPLSLNEIRSRAFQFAKEFAKDTEEDKEAKTFWDKFFEVFGVNRRRLATFEEPVKKASGAGGFIDLLWKGTLLVEHKSAGKDLDRAKGQAYDYFSGLKDRDLPRYVVVSDFARIRLYDLDAGGSHVEFPLEEFPQNIDLFGFISGYKARSFGAEDPVNLKAAEKLGAVHDLLEASGYVGHDLEVFLVRILFCLFADDSGIFERGAFRQLLELRTAEDGSDLGMWLAKLFQVLNTPEPKRGKRLDEQLAGFPYVNGKLFSENLVFPDFDTQMRETLFVCVALDWSLVNPAIFGGLFQSIMNKEKRRNLGAHYTSESNILKVLRPLFLDDLRAEFEQVRGTKRRLEAFHAKLGEIRILDPACGCGNFLVIAYRELRMLEIDVLRELLKKEVNLTLDVLSLLHIDVDQFFGIEYEEWPAQIAQVALWLTDHLMNLAVSTEFGQYVARLPLKKSPVLFHGNALRTDWRTVVDPALLTYVVGNPPFIGHQYRSDEQQADMTAVWGNTKTKRLDYVTCWFRKAVDYMEGNHKIVTALVATNSITQGEQVGTLWKDLIARGGCIHFAHRTFQWESEARGRAAVHCVIIGFALEDTSAPKTIFDYATPRSQPHAIRAKNVNPYLVDGPTVLLPSRTSPTGGRPGLFQGSKPWDGGHLLFTEEEKVQFIKDEPLAAPWIKPYVGGEELINGGWRSCLWLKGIDPVTLQKLPLVKARLKLVAKARRDSPTVAVNALATTPTLFAQDRQPDVGYLAIPEVSSESRVFVPMEFLPPKVIASNKLLLGVGATLYHFGILNSTMHMSWVRSTAGRLKSDISYAPAVYNNFPWPDPNPKQEIAIADAAQAVLDARAKFPDASLADLYGTVSMPPELTKAHAALDKVVDAAYGRRTFKSEAERTAYLFERYVATVVPLAAPTKAKKPKAPKTLPGVKIIRKNKATP